MSSARSDNLPVLKPDLQISFYYRLRTFRGLYLHEALAQTVTAMDVALLDDDLVQFAGNRALRRLAGFGIRGEVVFAVPLLLRENPRLLGYYRLLYGLSQKEFYNKGPFGRFASMESQGKLARAVDGDLPRLCASLCGTGQSLLSGIKDVSLGVVHDLQLLTLGPQWRGSENTRLGQFATRGVFELIHGIVAPHVVEATKSRIAITNAAGRRVMIEFSSDPDISITESLPSGGERPLISIEIKGGRDASNIHNRLGEAEKSHQKARKRGFFEFWTIVGVPISPETVSRESPTTSHVFDLPLILEQETKEHKKFREMLCSVLGIRV